MRISPTTLVRRVGIVVAQADVIGAERTVVVAVGLPVGNGIELVERLAPAGLIDAHQQLVLARIVALGPCERDAVVGMIRHAIAVAVGLHPLVALAILARICRADSRQHAARRIAWNDIRADRLLEHAEVVPMVQDSGLDAVPLLAVGRLRLAADLVLDACGSHQVALVGGVDEHPPAIPFAAEHGHRRDTTARSGHALRAVEPLVAIDADLILLDEILEHFFRHVRLENPHRPLGAVDRRRSLALVAVLFALLPGPRARLLVVLPDPVVELARQPADDGLVAGVCEPEASARQAAEMPVRTDDDDALSQTAGLDGGDHAGGGSAVNDEIELRRGRRLSEPQRQNRGQKDGQQVHGSGFMVHGSGFRVQGSKRIFSDRLASANADS